MVGDVGRQHVEQVRARGRWALRRASREELGRGPLPEKAG